MRNTPTKTIIRSGMEAREKMASTTTTRGKRVCGRTAAEYSSAAVTSSPDYAALIDSISSQTLSFRQLRIHIRKLAHSLRNKLGVEVGEEEAETEFPEAELKKSSAAALSYSLGKGGKSKRVLLSHDNFIVTAAMVTADQETKEVRW
ncbi:unnamed protein product [Linum trigynum]|uniref:Uncharacterized protein n=1 Tax=Linum trigynum TaxID=586398 RepID=A0AAV2G6I3_9ROSI